MVAAVVVPVVAGAYGPIGKAATVSPMRRLGVEVWPVHTVRFSNHTDSEA